jgi:hypothetical protein
MRGRDGWLDEIGANARSGLTEGEGRDEAALTCGSVGSAEVDSRDVIEVLALSVLVDLDVDAVEALDGTRAGGGRISVERPTGSPGTRGRTPGGHLPVCAKSSACLRSPNAAYTRFLYPSVWRCTSWLARGVRRVNKLPKME